MKKRVFSILKYVTALCLLLWVLSRAELGQVRHYLHHMPLAVIVTAFIAFNVSQWFSAARLRYYYAQSGIQMSQRYALALNYAGMFYNLLLPGGIGGDAYKVYLLKRNAAFPVLPGIRIQLANRGNGLLAMIAFMLLAFCQIDLTMPVWPRIAVALAVGAISVLGYRWIAGRFLQESAETTWSAFRYSMGVQAAALFAVLCLLMGMHAQGSMMEYLLLFLAAGILGLLPVTVGGLGVREATFFYGAHYFNLVSPSSITPELGVSLSLCYFGLTAISSLPGIYCSRWLAQQGDEISGKRTAYGLLGAMPATEAAQ